MLFEVKNLMVSYGDIEVLHKVSLHVNKGEIVAIVGGNSAGKTTLLSAISGLIGIKSGEIKFNEQNITKMKAHEIVELGIVQIPEGRLLFPLMTVTENLELGAFTNGAKKYRSKTMEEVFSFFPILRKRKRQLAGSLSGGEAQMCAIGRGLMSRPKLLILDEPSLGLAPLLVRRIFGLVSNLQKEGITILLVEQNVKASLEIADRAYVIENGNIIMEGLGKDLIDDERIRKAYLGI